MNNVIYSTDSEEHLVNTGELSQPEWCEFTQQEIDEDIQSGWDMYDRIHGVNNNE